MRSDRLDQVLVDPALAGHESHKAGPLEVQLLYPLRNEALGFGELDELTDPRGKQSRHVTGFQLYLMGNRPAARRRRVGEDVSQGQQGVGEDSFLVAAVNRHLNLGVAFIEVVHGADNTPEGDQAVPAPPTSCGTLPALSVRISFAGCDRIRRGPPNQAAGWVP